MKKLSVIIPARNEPHLIRTIEDIFRNAYYRDFIQVVAILEGYWPEGWAEAVERSKGRLVTIHNSTPKGMRAAITAGVAASSGFEYVLKSDAHCSFAEQFDDSLMGTCGDRTVMVPRRYRLDVDNWAPLEDGRPPVDYEYISFPKNKSEGMGGRIWNERATENAGKLIDELPTFQGSCWIMKRKYFHDLMLMDEATYGRFFFEAQEICLKAWLGGGQVLVNKHTSYAHWHKPREVGRGYQLEAGLREQGVAGLRRWLTGRGWRKQTLPFESLLERFPGMPGWSDDWKERVRAQ